MKRNFYNIKEFKNGNIVVWLDEPVSENVESVFQQTLFLLSEILQTADCYFVGDFFCCGNSEMGCRILNIHSGFAYTILGSEIESLSKGDKIKLYAQKPTDEDMKEFYNQ